MNFYRVVRPSVYDRRENKSLRITLASKRENNVPSDRPVPIFFSHPISFPSLEELGPSEYSRYVTYTNRYVTPAES